MQRTMKSILVVTNNQAWCARLEAQLSNLGAGYKLDVVSNLMDAYSHSEDSPPGIAIVAECFIDLPEFKTILMLFSALNIRWVRLSDATDEGKPPNFGRNFRSLTSIPDIDIAQPITTTARQLLALISRSGETGNPCEQRRRLPTADSGKNLILMGASTGGTEALSEVLSSFDSRCPPTIVVQHTGKDFGAGLIHSIDRLSQAKVVVARNGLTVTAGMICIAAGAGKHLRIAAGRAPLRVWLVDGDPVSGHMPSIDVMFNSGVAHAPSVVAGLLTGMGRDGAQGLLELRKAGAHTFAQDEKSSVVYGMPKVAWENGAAEKQVPLSRIARHIFNTCNAPRELGGLPQ